MQKELRRGRIFCGLCLCLALAACQVTPPEPRERSLGHISTYTPPPDSAIPEPVQQTAYLPPPQAAPPLETYTVVVNEVPVRELLFALARDAAINVDIHPQIEGFITLNAVDQSLPQILDRISRQIDLRYRIADGNVVITPDTPFLRTYKVDYVNIGRTTESTVSVSTQIAQSGVGEDAGGGGDNNSTLFMSSGSDNQFWQTLIDTVKSITGGEEDRDDRVVANRETGFLLVRATSKQHEQVQSYVDQVISSARRQVLIEATVVEVELRDIYQAGVDWQKLATGAGVSAGQSLLGGNLSNAPFFFLDYANSRNAAGQPDGDITVALRLLKEFGDTNVLSSPKIMTLNNQTAVLKVVDNIVYFEVDGELDRGTNDENSIAVFDTTARTVPVGLVMSVTPQIDSADQVLLNVRPTITRINGFVEDPNPGLAEVGAVNAVPQIQVREMESMLRVSSGQVAVLGGLMQDTIRKDTDGVPVVSDIKQFGEIFKFRDNEFVKTELVIFLRTQVIRSPDVRSDLREFEQFLPENLPRADPLGREYDLFEDDEALLE